jgi:hypothetical protein
MTTFDRPLRRSLLLAWLALAALALPAAARPMEFSLQGPAVDCASCSWILAEGEIDSGTPERFQAFLAQTPDAPRLVRFNSLGGFIAFAMRLGQMMREGGFDTVVGQAKLRNPDGGTTTQLSDCYSACTIAFLGGIRRSVTSGVFGIHRPMIRRWRADEPAFDREQTEMSLEFWNVYIGIYALRMGASADFVSRTFADPAMRLLSHDDLVTLKIVTEPVTKPAAAKPGPG